MYIYIYIYIYYIYSIQNISLLVNFLHYYLQFLFKSSLSDGKFTPSHLYLFIKGLIFVILS